MSNLRERAELAKQLFEHLEEAANIEDQINALTEGGATSTAVVAAPTGKKRGRPAASTNGDSSPAKTKKRAPRGKYSMKGAIVHVLKGKKNGLSLKDITKEVLKIYETNAADKVQVVYQSLYKLWKNKDIDENERIEKTDKDTYRLKSAA